MLSGPSSYPKQVSKEPPSWIRLLSVWPTMRNLQGSTFNIFMGHLCQYLITPKINRFLTYIYLEYLLQQVGTVVICPSSSHPWEQWGFIL